uniref:Capsid protein alpha n=1 Tax=Alphanodavirus HB-2007/CHN TaxID=756850 RepID=D6PUS1_9VIRU|nr:coat protein [Alphanodavirus HB-2007/CHN]
MQRRQPPRPRPQRTARVPSQPVVALAAAPPRRRRQQPRRPRRLRRQRRAVINTTALAQLTEPGLAFLKCAFAPPDFNTDPGKGIPDKFEGKVLSRKDVLTDTPSFPANTDVYLLVLPTPGVAYWRLQKAAGTPIDTSDNFTAVLYPGFTSLFGTTAQSRSANVSSFRYASMNCGLYPSSNMMQYGGSVSVWKVPIQMSTVQYPVSNSVPTSQHSHALQGLEGVTFVSQDNYTESFIKGMYASSVCNEPEFEFNNILEGVQTLPPVNVSISQSGQPFGIDAGAENVCGITGFGNMDAIIIKVTTPTGATNVATFKNWACIEYRPTPNATLYQYAHDSPPLDEIALREYRRVARCLPVAVPCAQNATMWERVKALLKSGLSALSAVPGPVGMTASGIQGVSELLSGLFL